MLSTKVITNSGQASHYYGGADNYYEQDEAQLNSLWYGLGAAKLGLHDRVETQQFQQLLNGQLPNGQQIGFQTKNGGIQHRPGFDLTFSAPKSVSMLALMTRDAAMRQTLTQSVVQAAQRTLDHIETDCAQARVTHNGQTDYEATGNLTAALYLHDLSREADPQLHVHSVIMNLTQREDGQWRSLASQARGYGRDQETVNGFIERVRSSKNHYGLLFRHELAYQLKQAGFALRTTDGRQGFFEIDGVPDTLIQAFSLRSRQIQSHLEKQGLEGDKAADIANVATRQPKSVNRDELLQNWIEKGQKLGYNLLDHIDGLIQTVQQPATHEPSVNEQSVAQQALNQALSHLTERQVQATTTELLNLMARFSERPVGLATLKRVIEHNRDQGQLVTLPTRTGQPTTYLPARVLAAEQSSWQAMERTVATPGLQGSDAGVSSYLAHHPRLSPQQQQAIRKVVTAAQAVQRIDGPTGSGKTTLAQPLAEYARLSNWHAVFVSGSHSDQQALQHHVASQSQSWRAWLKSLWTDQRFTTAARLLKQPDHWLSSTRPSLVVIDDAHRLPAHQLHQLAALTENRPIKLVVMGDRQALAGPGPGRPYHDWVRDKGACQLAAEPAQSVNTRSQQVLNRIGDRLIAIPDASDRHQHMAAHYAHLTPEQRAATQLVAPNRAGADELNEAVRHQLKNRELLDGRTEITLPVLRPVRLSEPANQLARSYPKGNWLRFERDVPQLGIHAGDYRQIKARHYKDGDNEVVLASPRGDRQVWNPKRQPIKPGSVRLYEPQQRLLAVGDRLRWQGSSSRFRSGQSLTVMAITPDTVTVQTPRGHSRQLDRHQWADWHVEHGYAVTAYQLKHRPQQVIVDQPAATKDRHQRQLYTAVQQARQQAWVYTNDRQRFLTGLARELPEPNSALATLQQQQQQAVNSHETRLVKATAQALSAFDEHEPDQRAQTAIQHALDHLAEHQTTFSQAAVMKHALTHALGEVNTEELEAAVQQAEANGQLVRGVQSSDGVRWTTRQAIEEERTIIDLARKDQGQLPSLTSQQARRSLDWSSLKPEHAQVLGQWLANRDRISVIQGHAGTGKTTLMAQAQTVLQQDGLTLHCLAPTHPAVKALRDRGLTADTLDRHLQSNQGGHADVLVVDENSMTANRKMHSLLQQARANHQRVLLVGDRHQYTAIEAGHPHELLQQAGVTTYHLTDIQRQRSPELLQAVQSAYQGDYASALAQIDHRMVEQGHTQQRLQALARAYAHLTPQERAQTLIITLGNQEREQLNQVLQQVLQEPLSPSGQTVSVLTPRHFSQAEAAEAKHYAPNDIVRFQQAEPHLGIQAGDYGRIMAQQPEIAGLVLKRSDNETIHWRPQDTAPVECYRAQQRTLARGDVIEWTRTERQRGLIRSELARVETIQGDYVTLQPVQADASGLQPGGEAMTLNHQNHANQHWDLAYAVTGYSAQGSTVSRVLMEASSQHRYLLTQRAVLIGLSRAMDDFVLYTDDKTELTRQVLAKSGHEPSALAAIGQTPEPQQARQSPSVAEPASKQQTTHQAAQRTTRGKRHDSRPIVTALHERTEQVAERLLGSPKEKTGSHWVYSWSEQMGGANHHKRGGSLYLAVDGPQRGCWFSFKEGEGGNLLQLMQAKHNLTFQGAIQQAEAWLGRDLEHAPLHPSHDRSHRPQSAQQDQLSPQQRRRIAYARQLAANSQPIQGTLAERYLRENRGIHLNQWPASLRYHPGVYSQRNDAIRPALLAIAQNRQGETQAVQAIFLDNNSGNKAKDLAISKQTWGVVKGASVPLTNQSSRHAYVAEGPETGLSIQQCRPEATTYVTLGKNNFQHFETRQQHESITLCLDHDTKGNHQKLIQNATNQLDKQARHLWQAMPEQPGTDFNDVLWEKGESHVQRSLANGQPMNQQARQRQQTIQNYQQQTRNSYQAIQTGEQSKQPAPQQSLASGSQSNTTQKSREMEKD